MINIFLEKSCAKCGGETIARPSSKNWKLDIFPIDGLKFYTCCFYFMPNWRLFKYIDVKLQTLCFCLILSFLKNKKEVWNYSPFLIFCMIFEEKHLSCYVLLTVQISLPGCLFFARYWAIRVLQLFMSQVLT